MDLDETETYAAAALLTLALYSSQVEVGVDRFHENASGEYRASAWGCPPDLDLDEVLFGENLRAEDLKHFWGWDCCGARGLCQRVYESLAIPQRRWTGLLKIPETVGDISTDAGVDDLIEVVERYSRMLDPELCYTRGKAVEVFSVQRQRSIDVGELAVIAAGCSHDLEDDLDKSATVHRRKSESAANLLHGIAEDDSSPLLQSDTINNAAPTTSESSKEAEESQSGEKAETLVTQCPQPTIDESSAVSVPKSLEESNSDEDAAYEQYVESLKQPEQRSVEDETEDVVIPNVGFTPRDHYDHPASGKSCLALRSAIKACLLKEALKIEEKDGKEDICVRIEWYDARCRIALMRLSHWLRIPYTTMSAFEVEAAIEYLNFQDNASVNKKSTALSRWLKISAMAIGGGAAVAVTGGLAAPAVAAGLGAAVTLAGGGAAAASAVTGFAASTAGTATITTAFGAFGAHSTGSTMYKRTNDIKEFAFWDLSMDWATEIEKKKAREKGAASKLWPWGRSTEKTKKSSMGKRSVSMSQLPQTDENDAADPSLEGYVQIGESPTEPNSPEPMQADGIMQAPLKKVEVVPGLEVDLDELEVTKSTSNYTDWWEGFVKAKERPDLLPVPANSRGDDSKLALTIAVSGVISDDEHFIDPWRKLPSISCDRFAVIWETNLLKKVSDALVGLITSQVANEAAKWFIKKYLYTGLLSAVAIPLLLTNLFEMTVGNNWALAMDRSLKAGELLAEYLLQGLHGHRPVTLIGYSLGARCIFRCLLTLYNAGKRGIIENVILLGAPVSLTDYKWARARTVIAGRFVNGYSSRDWVLGIVFRVGRGVLQNVAGISPISVPGVDNVDLSSIISAQTDYTSCMKDILPMLNL